MMHAYPKILPLVGKYADLVLSRPVEITEKVDGSCFCFGKDEAGKLHFRSKGALINAEAYDSGGVPDLFKPAVDHVLSVQSEIPPDTAFYGETLRAPRHNTLAYNRVPHNHIALFGAFDFNRTKGCDHETLCDWAARLDVDVVPLIGDGKTVVTSMEGFISLLNRESFLGGQPIEGFVVKDYTRPSEFNGMVYPLTVLKLVSEHFKEKHNSNPDWMSGKDKVAQIIERYRTQARWHKAIQHLREKGELVGEPKDIGALMKELHIDLDVECKEDFKEELYKIHSKAWKARVTAGFPEFYKQLLVLGDELTEKLYEPGVISE